MKGGDVHFDGRLEQVKSLARKLDDSEKRLGEMVVASQRQIALANHEASFLLSLKVLPMKSGHLKPHLKFGIIMNSVDLCIC